MVTRKLAALKGNKDKIFVVGGLVTSGRSDHDIDICVKNQKDIPLVEEALGPYKKDVHFSILKGNRPTSKIYLTVDTKDLGALGTKGLYNETRNSKTKKGNSF